MADFTRAHEIVQRAHGFLHRRQRIEAMQLVEINVVRAQPSQTAFNLFGQMLARRPHVVRRVAEPERAFRRNDHPIATALDRLAKNFLGLPG